MQTDELGQYMREEETFARYAALWAMQTPVQSFVTCAEKTVKSTTKCKAATWKVQISLDGLMFLVLSLAVVCTQLTACWLRLCYVQTP